MGSNPIKVPSQKYNIGFSNSTRFNAHTVSYAEMMKVKFMWLKRCHQASNPTPPTPQAVYTSDITLLCTKMKFTVIIVDIMLRQLKFIQRK